jgi:hypothetical protein
MIESSRVAQSIPVQFAVSEGAPMDLPGEGRGERMGAVRGMLGSLERLTPTGRQSLMENIVRLLRSEALDPTAQFRPSQRQVVVRSLDDLEHELWRAAPDPGSFDRKAQILIDVFAIA